MVMPEISILPHEEEEEEILGSPWLSLGESVFSAPGASLESAPTRILLGTLGDGRLRVRSPFTVLLTTENEDYIAEVVELSEFGFGKNPSEAIADIRRAIAELYFTLEQEQGRLGTDLIAVWDALRGQVEKVA